MPSPSRPVPAPPGRALPMLAGMLVAAFALQVAGESGWQAAASWSEATLGLTPAAWTAGEYWRLASYGLIHSPTNLFHLGLVLAAVLGPGVALARELGPRLPLAAWVLGQVLGGLCWLGFHREAGELHFGATAGAYALLAAYAVRHPDRVFRLLVFFVLPLRLRPRAVLLALLGGEAFFLLIGEVLQRALPFAPAASAHLAGAVAGWLVLRVSRPAPTERPAPVPARIDAPDPEPELDPRAELDRILDRINQTGLGSLTPAERRTLAAARDLLSRR
ncbi:MAG: rhomboid family intramembrane serine protease [Verrucomicrobiota bacterium]